MSHEFAVEIVRSPEDLGRLKDQWNQLWQNSHVTSPSGRAGMLQLWLDRYNEAGFCAVTVSKVGLWWAPYH